MGIHATYEATARLFNTILVSQTVGAYAAGEGRITLNSTLWQGNGTDWAGSGTVNHTNDVWGNPGFVDPGAGDYHLRLTSAAIDRGIDAGVTVDIDGDLRPIGPAPDLGADEFPLPVQKIYLPVVARDGP